MTRLSIWALALCWKWWFNWKIAKEKLNLTCVVRSITLLSKDLKAFSACTRFKTTNSGTTHRSNLYSLRFFLFLLHFETLYLLFIHVIFACISLLISISRSCRSWCLQVSNSAACISAIASEYSLLTCPQVLYSVLQHLCGWPWVSSVPLRAAFFHALSPKSWSQLFLCFAHI